MRVVWLDIFFLIFASKLYKFQNWSILHVCTQFLLIRFTKSSCFGTTKGQSYPVENSELKSIPGITLGLNIILVQTNR